MSDLLGGYPRDPEQLRYWGEPLRWNELNESQLASIRAAKTSRECVGALREARSVRHMVGAGTDGLVIASPSMLLPSDADGATRKERLGNWFERVCMAPDSVPMAGPMDRLACAIAALKVCGKEPERFGMALRERAQGIVDAVLIEFPAILYPLFVIPVFDNGGETFMSVFAALSDAGIARLPSHEGGLAESAVQAFAETEVIGAPFKKKAPKKAMCLTRHGTWRRESVEHGDNMFPSSRAGAPFGAQLMASMIEIGRRRPEKFVWPMAVIAREMPGRLVFAFAKALPLDFTGEEGRLLPRSVGYGPCLRELATIWKSQPWEVDYRSLMRKAMGSQAGHDAQMSATGLGAAGVQRNFELIADALVTVGIHSTRLEAAQVMCKSALELKADKQLLPRTHFEGALGFLQGFVACGGRLAETSPAPDEGVASRAQQSITWNEAHALVLREQSMRDIIGAAMAAPQAQVAPPRGPRLL